MIMGSFTCEVDCRPFVVKSVVRSLVANLRMRAPVRGRGELLTPEARVVEARVVVGDGDERHAGRPPHGARQLLLVVHRRLVQELCKRQFIIVSIT